MRRRHKHLMIVPVTKRFIAQWLVSEWRRRSVVTIAFWYFSLGGGATLVAYAIYREDPVFIVGQAAGLLIYSRNLYLIFRERRNAVASET